MAVRFELGLLRPIVLWLLYPSEYHLETLFSLRHKEAELAFALLNILLFLVSIFFNLYFLYHLCLFSLCLFFSQWQSNAG